MLHAFTVNLHARPLTGLGWRTVGLACAAGLVGLATPDSVQAQSVFRIVGADGRVTFSDKPPVAAAKATLPQASAPEPQAAGPALPYELQQVVGKYPVTFYSSKDCAPCDSGRSLLRTRGVPFTEKTITTAEDAEALQRLSGSTSLPLLTLGSQQVKGFQAQEWAQYLSAAGYPEKSRLPARYANPAPAPLVALQTPAIPAQGASAATEAVPQPSPRPAPLPRVSPANPAGIQF